MADQTFEGDSGLVPEQEHHEQTDKIYRLNDPRTGEPRYVGKSNDPTRRYGQHIGDAANHPETAKGQWINSLAHSGFTPELEVIDEVPHDQWPDAERRHIEQHNEYGWRLTNIMMNQRCAPNPGHLNRDYQLDPIRIALDETDDRERTEVFTSDAEAKGIGRANATSGAEASRFQGDAQREVAGGDQSASDDDANWYGASDASGHWRGVANKANQLVGHTTTRLKTATSATIDAADSTAERLKEMVDATGHIVGGASEHMMEATSAVGAMAGEAAEHAKVVASTGGKKAGEVAQATVRIATVVWKDPAIQAGAKAGAAVLGQHLAVKIIKAVTKGKT